MIEVESEAGVSEYSYGKLGERTGERRELNTLLGVAEPLEFETGYRVDYLGRSSRSPTPTGSV